MWNLKNKQQQQKTTSALWLPEAGDGEKELDEGGPKAQTSRYEIIRTRDATYNKMTTDNTAV